MKALRLVPGMTQAFLGPELVMVMPFPELRPEGQSLFAQT